MSAWDDVQTEDVKQIEAAVFRQMEGRSNSDPCSPWADLTLALCQRLSASEARAKELERERDEARAELASWGPTKNALRRENADLASRAATAEARREEAEREVRLLTHKVITCGVAAEHPDPALSRRVADYGGPWDSPQAEAVRKLRAERDEARRALRDLVTAYDFSYLDRGIGTATSEGRRWLRARALSGSGAKEGR
jgi:hypothetical protein